MQQCQATETNSVCTTQQHVSTTNTFVPFGICKNLCTGQYLVLNKHSQTTYSQLLQRVMLSLNPLNAKLNPICHLLALLGALNAKLNPICHLLALLGALNAKLNPICHLLALLGALNTELNPICHLLALLGALNAELNPICWHY